MDSGRFLISSSHNSPFDVFLCRRIIVGVLGSKGCARCREQALIHVQRLNQAQANTDFFTRLFEIVFRLKVHPVTGAVAEVISEPDSGVGGDGAFAQNDFIDPTRRYPDGTRELVLTEIFRSQVLT